MKMYGALASPYVARVAMFAAFLLDRSKTGADFHTLGCVNAHHRTGDIGIQPTENRFPQAWWHAASLDIDPGANRIAGFSQFIHKGLKLRHARRVRAEKSVVIGRRQIHRLKR